MQIPQMDNNSDDEQFLAHQQSWLRPFFTQAFRLASRNEKDNWKQVLYDNFQKCLEPTFLCGAQIAVGMTGSKNHPHLRLHWSARQSSDPPVRIMDVSAKILPHFVSPGADVDVLINNCYNFVCQFLSEYDIGDQNCKLSPFDQASWDKMIWLLYNRQFRQYWTAVQFTTTKTRSLAVSKTEDFVRASSTNGLPPVPLFFSNDSILTSTTSDDRVAPLRNPNAAKSIIVRYFTPVPGSPSFGDEHVRTNQEKDESHKFRFPRFTYKVCVESTGFPDFYTCIKEKQTGACLEQAEHRMEEINTQTFKLKERARKFQLPMNNNNATEQRSRRACDSAQLLNVRNAEIHPQDAAINAAIYAETGLIRNETEAKTDKANKASKLASPEVEHPPDLQEDADPELKEDLGTESADPATFPWNIAKIVVPVVKTGTVNKTKKSIAAKQGKSSQKEDVKHTPVKTPETPMNVQLAVRKEPLYHTELLEDIEAGYSMLHFLSVGFLRAASWISELEVRTVTAMIFHAKRFCFVNGRWIAEDPEAIELHRLPRVVITCVHEVYDTAGNPLLRGIFVMPPENVSFKDWYTITTQMALYRAVETVPLAGGGQGLNETLTEWLENGIFRPRVESIGVVLEAIVNVLKSYKVDFRIGLHFLPKTRSKETNGAADPEFSFWDSLLKSFPSVELLVDPPFPIGHYREWKNTVNARKIFSGRDMSDPETGYHMEIGPRMLITQIATQSSKAKENAQEIIFSAVTGSQWDVAADFLYYQITAGFKGFGYVVSGFHMPCQRTALNKIKNLN